MKFSPILTCVSLFLIVPMSLGAIAQVAPPGPGVGYTDSPMLPGSKWRVHDKNRPRPTVLKPLNADAGHGYGVAPSDATVLFDGTDLSKWKKSGKADEAAPWKATPEFFEVVPKSGSIETKDSFGDIQLHIEWSAPEKVEGNSQGRGNSGVIIMGRYEIQILDSYQNDSYADGQAASIYGQFPPQVNVTNAPGKWNAYDILFEAPRFEGEKLIKPARATVLHNGVLVQNAKEFIGPMAHKEVAPYRAHPPKGPIQLQDHNNPTRFRNVWVRPLREEIDLWVEMPGSKENKLAGAGKKIVLVSGDDEYRSEEALPMLGKILSEQHGFDCVVLFAINPETQSVDPNYQSNIPGLHHLDDADAMILLTRFRSLPDWQMAHFEKFVRSGKPFAALRTATHPFNFTDKSPTSYKEWSWNNKEWVGGFGQQLIGETWHSHHGVHNKQATRGVIVESKKDNPILKGVKDVFGPSDVYGVVHLPESANVLMLGQVLTGMNHADPPLEGAKNNPMMPLVWTKSYQYKDGKPGKLFCTTMGAATDLQSEDLRRLIVNASYWMVDLEEKIPDRASVTVSEKYKPSNFGFKDPTFFSSQRIRPVDLVP
jgi:type 1 glutamine amidotransferase